MPDQITKFYQGYIGVSGTNITGIVPTSSNYTVKHLVLTNTTSGTQYFSLAYNNLGSAANYILPSGISLGTNEWAESTDIFVLNAGDSIFASASVLNGITVVANGVIST